MKLTKLAVLLLAAATIAPATAQAATDNPLGNILSGLAGKGSSNSGSSSTGSGIGDAIGGLIGGLISTDKIDTNKMVGTWTYSAPAVCFKSENLLKKAGGSAVAAAAEGKLSPYYQRLGLNKMVLTINQDMTFTMKSGVLTASGTIEKADNGDIMFHFTALKKIKIGTMQAYVTMTGGNSMSLMFDVSKLISIIKAVGSVSGSSAIGAISSLLDSYDGVCAGFKLQRQ